MPSGLPDPITEVVATVLARALVWIRDDVTSKGPSVQTRAEDALAAMISKALTDQ